MRTLRPIYTAVTTTNDPDNPDRWFARNRRILLFLLWTAIIVTALFFRTAGLFRGLDAEITYHPDAPKQVMSFHNYINDRYIWYDGTLFMDGYPLFLNHVDEWITRPLFALKEMGVSHLYSAQEVKRLEGLPHEDFYPRGWWLFHWLRTLRVFYSILILIGAYALSRAIGMGRPISFITALLMALAPMEWVLAHNATGDIGVSLFGVAMWLALARHMRTEGMASLLLAGVMGGFAFASKYQGLLICGVPYMFLMLRHLYIRVEPVRLLARGAAFSASVLAGIIVATPQFFINPGRTRKLIFENFEFIKNYKVPAEILEKPFLERAWLGMEKNTWPLLENLGPILLTMALLGSLIAAIQLISRKKRGEPAPAARACFAFSLFILPFYCLVISLVGKYNVQPFHFAYLMVPLFLSACYLIHSGWNGRRLAGKFSALIAVPLLLLSDASLMVREYYFWAREDTVEVMKHFQHHIFDHFDERPPDIRPIRRIHVEPENLPVFRNRHQLARLPYSSFWRELEMAPVPAIPFPARLHWIFDNGPAFPRDDRMFIVPANQTVRKSVVWEEKPAHVKLGLNSGIFPVWIAVKTGGQTSEFRLSPHSQIIMDVPIEHIQSLIPAEKDEFPAWRLPLSVSTRNSTAWVTVLTSERAETLYRLFGGAMDTFPESLRLDITRSAEIAEQVARCQYYGQTRDFAFDMSPHRGLSFLHFEPLAAGAYLWNADVVIPDGGATLTLLGSEFFSGHDWSNSAWTVQYDLTAGFHSITHRFQKTFALYTYQLAMRSDRGTGKIVHWELKPDTQRILSDLQAWDERGIRPEWAHPHHPRNGEPIFRTHSTGIIFGNTFELLNLSIPQQAGDQGTLTAYVAMRQIKPTRHPHEQVFFIHFQDKNDQTVGVMTFPVYRALDSEQWDIPITVPIDTKLEGEYRMLIGMISARAVKRLSIKSTSDEYQLKGNRIYVGDVTFTTL